MGDYSELVTRLRGEAHCLDAFGSDILGGLLSDAADAIEALAAENDRLHTEYTKLQNEHAELVRNTGGLPGALVAKALAFAADSRLVDLMLAFIRDERTALRAATFEAAE
jgi:hypothetical protein